jgi:uncharacterized membrane protein
MRPTTLVAVTLGAVLIAITLSSFSSDKQNKRDLIGAQALPTSDDVKSSALEVLQTRCNTCHVRQNPGKVFTADNMNTLASKINQQVFVKKRMPRGKRLTNEEYTMLQNWLNTQNIK